MEENVYFCKVGKEVGKVVVVSMWVVGTRGAFNEAVRQLVYCRLGLGKTELGISLHGQDTFDRVLLGHVGEQHGHFVGITLFGILHGRLISADFCV